MSTTPGQSFEISVERTTKTTTTFEVNRVNAASGTIIWNWIAIGLKP